MSQSPRNTEPIPGYLVKERIGVGGYGEVWSAQAPGGLTKAIKFVYGYFDDARASRELKALDRIKQVRHPFLLSLERFEIVDGQLIIVTELADMSLKDRYEQVRQTGAEGIFRDELLRYLRDAADALDYMNESFSLQHLDVKPENMLLVGGHVKVADFGLVKDLQHDATASLMGGLTPIYAAPEVFDDRPSQRSDQYSLAIVYQEMLTGHLPFPGRTPAQLASQHLHASPRLAGLSPTDQQVIAKALSKDPAGRFPNCRSLIDALLGQLPPGGWTEQTAKPATNDTVSLKSHATKTDTEGRHRPAAPGVSQTQVLGRDSTPLSESRCAAAMALMGAIEPIVELGPLEVAENNALRPTLFLGIGGTAGRVLRRLRRRLGDRYGAAAGVPSMQMLLLDTDAKYLYQTTEGPRDTALSDRETLALPLRGAHDYTTDSRNILGWLSRRWLYNIPRSLQTEGRRPLGRLALVDHAPQVLERLRGTLREMLATDAIAKTAETTGAPLDAKTPRVFVIASLSGGTGGGMALDLAYTVRKLLTELGCSDDGVCGIFTHSTDRNTAAAELATANAYATLSELQHYRETTYTPGACGLPAPDSGGAFPHVYFVPLGHELNEQQFDEATDVLASYLYLNSATTAGSALDQCRASTSVEAAEISLRGFGTASVGSLQTSLPTLATELLCQEIVDHWRGTGHERRQRGAPPPLLPPSKDLPAAAAHAEQLGLNVATLRDSIGKLLDKELGGDADTVYARLRAKCESAGQTAGPGRSGPLLVSIREMFVPPTVGDDGLKIPPPAMHVAIERGLKHLASPLGEAIRDWILKLVDDPAARVGWATKSKDWFASHLKQLDTEAAELAKDTQHNIQALEHEVQAIEAVPARRGMFGSRRTDQKLLAEVDNMVLLILRLRMQEFTLLSVVKLTRLLNASVAAAGDQIKDVQRELGQWSAQFDAEFPWDDDEALPPQGIQAEVEDALAQQLKGRLADLARSVDARIQQDFLGPQGGLRGVCQKADAMRASMLAALRAEARAEILGALKNIALGDAVLGADGDPAQQSARLAACLNVARPKLTDCAGVQRLLAILPAVNASDSLAAALRERLDPAPTILRDADADLVLCYEQQELSLPHVAARLIAGRNDYTEIAARLHTRADVSWTPLPSPGEAPVQKPAPRNEAADDAPPAFVPSMTMTQPSAPHSVES
jgi:serine/threonine protein kinase